MPNGKPNILVLWGDDIGITNVERVFRWDHGVSHAEH